MHIGESMPIIFCLPFVGMLLSIAIVPLIAGEWWEKNRKYMVIFWSVLCLIPLAIRYTPIAAAEILCKVVVSEYVTFIILLFGLYCVAGNISIDGNFKGTPKMNILLLLVGTLLSGWIGTTGASMLMIRPIMKANSWRKNKVHTIVFFIFLVANLGGCLTPVGDPPLLMGFMRGVPFFWSLHLAPLLLVNGAVLLVIYGIIECRAYKKDLAGAGIVTTKKTKVNVSVSGIHNIVFIVMIVGAVILSGMLPQFPLFSGGITIIGDVEFGYAAMIEVCMILIAAFLSMKTTKKKVRIKNQFTWGPIKEVAVLFVGIFITMEPALLFLEAHGGQLGITESWQMFWVTGALSSFLDNTPTYLVFLTTAGTLGAISGIATQVGTISPILLLAISAGAVCMGANTYIGNAPNLMVRSMAEENGIKMPSFFGYMGWSCSILLPVFVLDTVLFFL